MCLPGSSRYVDFPPYYFSFFWRAMFLALVGYKLEKYTAALMRLAWCRYSRPLSTQEFTPVSRISFLMKAVPYGIPVKDCHLLSRHQACLVNYLDSLEIWSWRRRWMKTHRLKERRRTEVCRLNIWKEHATARAFSCRWHKCSRTTGLFIRPRSVRWKSHFTSFFRCHWLAPTFASCSSTVLHLV